MTPYVVFGLMTLLLWSFVFVRSHETRRAQLFMSALGLVGGPILDYFVYQSFWQPPQPAIPLGSMLFGFGFLGIVTALVLSVRNWVWCPEDENSVNRSFKFLILSGVFAGMGLASLLGMYSVMVTSLVFVGASIAIWHSRPELLWYIKRGAIVSLIVYMFLMGFFLLGVIVMGHSPSALAAAYSPFYVRYGPTITGVLALFWAITFGALAGPLYPWGKNLRLVPV